MSIIGNSAVPGTMGRTSFEGEREKAVKELSQIDRGIKIMDIAIENHEKLMDAFIRSIEPVLLYNEKADAVSLEKMVLVQDEELCPLAERIFTRASAIRQMTERMDGALNSLQL